MVAGPLRRVLAAIEGGAGSLGEIERATGLARDVVEASVDHLVRLGRLEPRRVAFGCPLGSCADCHGATATDAACGPGAGPGLTAWTVVRDDTP